MYFFNRSHLFLLLPLILFILVSGCSKDDDNPVSPPPSEGSLWINIGGDSTEISFGDLPKIDVDGAEAIQLSEFIDTTLIPMFEDRDDSLYDARPLYAYQIISGEDGFSASGSKGYPDNTWEHMTQGYIVTSTKRAMFPEELGLESAYNVRNVANIFVHRKFDVETPDSTSFVELKNVASVQVTNPDSVLEDALPLKDFVLPALSTPENYQYNMRSLDNFGPDEDMTWEELQTGYWLINTERTIFTDPDLTGGSYKLKVLQKIVVNQISVP